MTISDFKYVAYILTATLCLTFSSCKSSDDDAGTAGTTEDQDDDASAAAINDGYTYRLPVIFHVLYSDKSDASQYIPATRLKTILGYVNEIYKGGIYGESENINVDFELAKYDEKGNVLATPGVEYVKWTGAYPISPTDFMSENTGKNVKYIWDPNEYINVMMYNFASESNTDGEMLGISHMPLTVKGDSALAGLDTVEYSNISKGSLKYAYCSSINSKYIYSESTRYSLADKGAKGYTYKTTDIVETLAHELGHYLGLHHVYAETKESTGFVYADSCIDSDFCKDTPSYNRKEYEDYLDYYVKQHSDGNMDMNDLIKRTNCSGSLYYSANIMDYSVSLSYKISADQKRRIRNVLCNSPLIPGPKVKKGSRAIESEMPQELPMTIVK